MSTPIVATTPTNDDVVDKDKPMPDVVDTELDKVTCDDEVTAMVVVVETKTNELGDKKEAKGGEGNVLGQGVIEFLEKNRSLEMMEANKKELGLVVEAKYVVEVGSEREMAITKITYEDGMAEGTTNIFEGAAIELVEGGEGDELLVPSKDKKCQMEAVGMEGIKHSDLVKGLEPGEQDEKGWQLEYSKNKHDKNVHVVSQVESIEASKAKDDNDVVMEGQDDALEAHVLKPIIKHPHSVTHEVLEDLAVITLGGEDEKHGGIEPKFVEAVVAIGKKMTTDLQAIENTEFVMEEVPLLVADINMDATFGNVEEIGSTLEAKDSELTITSDMRLVQFGEIGDTLAKLHSATTIAVEGGFFREGLEHQVAKSSNKDSCYDSSNVIEEDDIMLDWGNKNYDDQEVKYEEVVIAGEGELTKNLPATPEYEFVKDTPSVYLDGTLVKVEGTCATLDQEDSQVPILVDQVIDQDKLTIVEDKSIKENTPVDTKVIQESKTKVCFDHEHEKAAHEVVTQIGTMFAKQDLNMKSQATLKGDLLDANASIIPISAQKSLVEATSSEVDEMESTYEVKDISTFTLVGREIAQHELQLGMDHPYSSIQDVLEEKMIITLGMEDKKNDEVAFKIGNELHVKSQEAIEGESVIEDANSLVNLDGTQGEVKEMGTTIEEKDEATTTLVHTELYQMYEVDATLEKMRCKTSNNVEGEFHQGASMDFLDVPKAMNLLFGQDDKNCDVDEVKYEKKVLAAKGRLVKDLLFAPDSKFVSVDTISFNASDVQCEATLCEVEELGAILEQVDERIPTSVGRFLKHDKPVIVMEKSGEESISLHPQAVEECKAEHNHIEEAEKDSPQVEKKTKEIWLVKKELVDWQETLEEHLHDKDDYSVSSNTQTIVVDATLGCMDKGNTTIEAKDSRTLTQASEEVIQDALAKNVIQLNKEYPHYSSLDDPKDEAPVMLVGDDVTDASIAPKFAELIVKGGGEFTGDLYVSPEGDLDLEDTTSFSVDALDINLHSTKGEVKEKGDTLQEMDSEITTAVHAKLDQMDEVDATIATLRCITSKKTEGKYNQAAYVDSDVPEEVKVVFGQDDKNYGSNEVKYEEAMPIVQGALEKDLLGAVDCKFISVDTMSLDASKNQWEASLGEVKELGSTMEQEDGEVLTSCYTVLAHDEPTIVEDKSPEENTSLYQEAVVEFEARINIVEVVEKDAPQVEKQSEKILSLEQKLVNYWQEPLEEELFDEDAYSVSSCAQNVLVDATSSEVDATAREMEQTEATSEKNSSQTLALAGVKFNQDILMTCKIEPSMEYPHSMTHDILEYEGSAVLEVNDEKYTITDLKFTELVVEDGREFPMKLQASTEVEDTIVTPEEKESKLLAVASTNLDQLNKTNTSLDELCSCVATTTMAEFSQDGLENLVADSSKKYSCLDSGDDPDVAKYVLAPEDKNHHKIEAKYRDATLVERAELGNDLRVALESLFMEEDSMLLSIDAANIELETTLCEVEKTGAPMEQNSSKAASLAIKDRNKDDLTTEDKSIEEGTSLATPDFLESDCVVAEKYAPLEATKTEAILLVEHELIKDWQMIPQENYVDVQIEAEQKMVEVHEETPQGALGMKFTSLISHDTSKVNEKDILVKEDDNDVSLEVKDTKVMTKSNLPLANVGQTSLECQFGRGSRAARLDMLEIEIGSTSGVEVRKDASREEKDSAEMNIHWELNQDETAAQNVELGKIGFSLASEISGGEVEASMNKEDQKGVDFATKAGSELTKDEIEISIDEEVINIVGDDEMPCKGIIAESKDAFQDLYTRSTEIEVAKVAIEDESIYGLGDNKEAGVEMEVVEQSWRETEINEKLAKSKIITDEILLVSRTIQPFDYASGDNVKDAEGSDYPKLDVSHNHMEKVPSVSPDVVANGCIEVLNDVVGEKCKNVKSTYADVSDDVLAQEWASKQVTDGDAKEEERVVGEVAELAKDQSLPFDVMKEGGTANDEIAVIPYSDETSSGDSKIAEEDVSDKTSTHATIISDGGNDDGNKKGLSFAASTSHVKPTTTTSPDKNVVVTSKDASKMFSMDRPASFGSSAPSMRPTAPPPASHSSISSPTEPEAIADPTEVMSDNEKLHEKLEMIRVKFLRFVCRMGATAKEEVVAQVLHRLSLAEGIHHGGHINQVSSLENARKKALQQETKSQEDLSFSCNILVLGKTGVGKSATINSILGEEKSKTDAFSAATTNVREIYGNVDGIQLHIIDTPGLNTNLIDQGWNKKILSIVKIYTKKCPPDIILYVDRLDSWCRDLDDLPLLRTITATLGASMWLNTVVALTHAASEPPNSSNGDPMTYEALIAQKSHIIQQSIQRAASDMRLMNPMAPVENHPYCHRNSQGQKVLPNGQAWRDQLMLLCYSTKILSETNSILKLQDPSRREHYGSCLHPVPLPFFLSSLLQRRSHPKLSADQGGGKEDSDFDIDGYPKLNMASENDHGSCSENVAVPLPDMVLPPSFDSDDPTYRYRYLETMSTVIARPIVDMHGWDHDYGFDRVSLENTLAIARDFPAAISVQFTKDKNFTIHLDSSITRKHGENASSLAAFDVQPARQYIACVLRGETKLNIKNNKTAGGFSVIFLGDTMATGVKVEDQLSVGKSLLLAASTGAMRAQGDTAYGAKLEARLKVKDYPINKFMLFLGLSLMRWRVNDLALGANMQSQFSVGRGSKMTIHIGINNRLSGHINVKMSTSEKVQMALLGLVPLAAGVYNSFCPSRA